MSVWSRIRWFLAALPTTAVVCFALTASAADEDFPTPTKRLQAERPKFAKRQQALLAERCCWISVESTDERIKLQRMMPAQRRELIATIEHDPDNPHMVRRRSR